MQDGRSALSLSADVRHVTGNMADCSACYVCICTHGFFSRDRKKTPDVANALLKRDRQTERGRVEEERLETCERPSERARE